MAKEKNSESRQHNNPEDGDGDDSIRLEVLKAQCNVLYIPIDTM